MTAKENWGVSASFGPTQSATDLASAVRTGDLDPVRAVTDALARISASDSTVGAFRRVRSAEAIAEAQALKRRSGFPDSHSPVCESPSRMSPQLRVNCRAAPPARPHRWPTRPTAISSVACASPER